MLAFWSLGHAYQYACPRLTHQSVGNVRFHVCLGQSSAHISLQITNISNQVRAYHQQIVSTPICRRVLDSHKPISGRVLHSRTYQ